MRIKSVFSHSFEKYGKVLTGYDVSDLLKKLDDTTDKPANATIYEPGDAGLESLPVAKEFSDNAYGGMPIQVGYCNGHNCMLNALEYHRSSEINVAATDAILMLGCQQDITDDFTYDTAKVEAFLVPAGTAVEVYATTLHYAPCGVDGAGFKVVVVLPKGTNLELEEKHEGGEDAHLRAKNKWLLGHPEGGLPEGSPMGLVGKNLNINE